MKKVIKYTIEAMNDFGYYRLEEKFSPEEFHKTIQNLVKNKNIKVTKEDENSFYIELKNDDGYWDEFNVEKLEFITENDFKTYMEEDEGVGGGMRGYVYIVENTEKLITIPISEYKKLLKDSKKLEMLEEAGVENWIYYGDALFPEKGKSIADYREEIDNMFPEEK